MTAFLILLAVLNLLAIAAAGRRYTVKTRREKYETWHEAKCAETRKQWGIVQ